VGQHLLLAIVGHRPALVYDDASNGLTKRLVHSQTTNGNGWFEPVLIAGSPLDQADLWGSLAEVNGLPALSYHVMSGNCLGFALPDLSL
jgi:hypothetical protein